MTCKKMALTCCLTTFILAGCECIKGPQGHFDGSIEKAKHRVSLAGDGTVIAVETLVGGNWEPASPVTDAGKGKKILDIKLYMHDGSETGLTTADGTQYGQSMHPHSGGQNPPWNGHCHYVWYLGSQKMTSHC